MYLGWKGKNQNGRKYAKLGRELEINFDLCGRVGFNREIILTSDFFHVYPQNPLWFFLDAHGQKQ